MTATVRGGRIGGKSRPFSDVLDNGVPASGGLVTAQTSWTADVVRPVAEIEVGGGWQRQVGRLRLLAQVGFVAQVWFNAGNSSRSAANDLIVGISNTDIPFLGGNVDGNDNLGLLGLTAKGGVEFFLGGNVDGNDNLGLLGLTAKGGVEF